MTLALTGVERGPRALMYCTLTPRSMDHWVKIANKNNGMFNIFHWGGMYPTYPAHRPNHPPTHPSS